MSDSRSEKLDGEPATILTLDAGGTTFTFSALSDGREIVDPLTLPAEPFDLAVCLARIVEGFSRVRDAAGGRVSALSFAFPGPADYAAGVIGDLPNLPAFRGGVPLGPILEDAFRAPVYINNDADLFALGEARFGLLPEVNRRLAEHGNPKRCRNLLGVTLGTGFGGGIVIDGTLCVGNNGAAGEIWLTRNKLDPESFAEEGASIRAVRQTYAREAGIPFDQAPEPREIDAIARGAAAGDRRAALEAFRRLGEVAGDATANALTLLDALVVVGGGLAGAAAHFLPALVGELNGRFRRVGGGAVPRLELAAFNLEDEADAEKFYRPRPIPIAVPGSARTVSYDPEKRTAVGVTRLTTARAVALGAYAFARERLDRR